MRHALGIGLAMLVLHVTFVNIAIQEAPVACVLLIRRKPSNRQRRLLKSLTQPTYHNTGQLHKREPDAKDHKGQKAIAGSMEGE